MSIKKIGANLAGIPKLQSGGKPNPIYVTDPNDPRLRAYQDSLFNYEAGEANHKLLVDTAKKIREGKSFSNMEKIKDEAVDKIRTDSYGNMTPIGHTWLTGRDVTDAGTSPNIEDGTGWGIDRYKKPVQPVKLVPKRDKLDIDQLPKITIKKLAAERPLPTIDIDHPDYNKERATRDWEGVPNLSVVYAKNRKTGKMDPVGIQNAEGETIDWDTYKDKPLPRGFQYPQQDDMRKKYQLGGLSAFNNIDFSSFDSVLEAGRPMVGSILGDAAQADNPEMFTNQMVKRLGNQAASNSAEEYWTQERDKALALTTNNRVRKQIEEDFNKNKEEVMQNYTTTQGATNFADAQSGFMDATGFLDLLSGLQFNTGGNLRSKLGYSDNSPFKSLGSIDIDGNVIDMSRTGKTLLATPDVGEPRELKPYSGTHVFPGATKVTETPIKAKGGKAKAQKWLNNYYQEGGQGAIGAQLEVGEVFATPDANIIDTAATEKHKDMVKDLVTDILGGADYVFSAMDRMKITRKEAENISFGLGGQLYKEGEIPEMPKEVLLSDLFKEGEDEVQIAEFVKRVRTRYPVTDKEDVFSKKANAGNKQSRGPLLSAIAFINEKKRGGNGAGGYASTYENKFNNGISTDANPIKDDVSHSAYEVALQEGAPEFQGGGSPLDMILKLIPFAGGIAQGIGQMGSARNNRRDITKLLAQDRELIKEQAASQRGFAGLATGINLAGIVNQDPTVTAPQYDTTQLDSSIRKVPRTLFDFASARLAAAAKPRLDQLFANSGSFSEAVNLSGGDAAANASAIANLGISEVQQNIQMENNYRMQKQGYSDKQITADVAAANATRGNSNRLIAGAAGALSGGVTAQGTITNQEQSALRNNNYQQTKNTVDWRAAKNDAWTNIINNVGGASTAISGSGILSRNPDDGVSESANPNTVQGAPEIPWESPDYFSLIQPNPTTITQPLPVAGMTPRQGVPTMQQQMYGAGYNQGAPSSGWVQDPVTGGWFPPGWVKK